MLPFERLKVHITSPSGNLCMFFECGFSRLATLDRKTSGCDDVLLLKRSPRLNTLEGGSQAALIFTAADRIRNLQRLFQISP